MLLGLEPSVFSLFSSMPTFDVPQVFLYFLALTYVFALPRSSWISNMPTFDFPKMFLTFLVLTHIFA